jgi:AraC-like DNA-binding protein
VLTIHHESIPARLPITRLLQPATDVAPFVRAFIVRDTRGCALAGDALLNRFPANFHCALTWFLQGGAELLHCGGQSQRKTMASCVANGCQTYPLTSRNTGDVQAFVAMFYPDAFHALFGVDLATLQNDCADARSVLPPQGVALVDAVFAAASDAQRQALVERFVREHARTHPLPAWRRIRRMGERVTLGVASGILGIGPRQLQRLALREAGASLQTLLRLRRGERSFLGAQRLLERHQSVNWADHAVAYDYSDQSHLARDCKAQTGRTPFFQTYA